MPSPPGAAQVREGKVRLMAETTGDAILETVIDFMEESLPAGKPGIRDLWDSDCVQPDHHL